MRGGEQWDQLLAAQAGVVTLGQAAKHGWTRHAVANQIASGRWSSPHRGVVATFTGRLTYEQRVWAGLCYAGRDATVSHASALWLQDRGWARPSVVHLTVPRMRDAVRAPGLRVYRSDLSAGELRDLAEPRRVRVERAVLECAGACRSITDAIAVVATAIQRRLTTADRLRVALDLRPCLRHRALLIEVLDMCGNGAHSLLEVSHERIQRTHGLPLGRRQVRHGLAVVDVDLDGLIVELDGRAGHLEVENWWGDMLRDDLHTVEGRAVLRFPGFLLLTHPHLVAHVEGAALARRGWTGRIRCPQGCPGLDELLRRFRGPVHLKPGE
jgi:very-short-patch-repair endonuclease